MAVDRPTSDASAPIIIGYQARADELLSPFGMEEHPQGGFQGLVEVILFYF